MQIQNYVDGQSVASTGSTFALVNPATGETVGVAPISTAAEVDDAFAAAKRAFTTWRRTTPAQRSAALLAIADAIEAAADELTDLEVELTGKPREITKQLEILRSADQLRFFAGAARVIPGLAQAEYVTGFSSSIRREPIGVVAQVTPWNYPLMMAIWKIGPALAAGNTVVLKPAETTPTTTVRLAQLAGAILPPGVLNVVTGDRKTGRLLSTHPSADMIAITGSTRAGAEVMRSASETMARLHLELGGKAPAVVFDDANIAGAAAGIASAAFFNAGQDCTAATRAIVHERIYDEFLAELVRASADFPQGAPHDPAGVMSPVNSATQRDRIIGLLDRLPAHATVVAGGKAHGPGFYIEPTIVSDVHQDDEIVQNEIFGPVLTVQSFSTEAEALALANGVEYALASSLWTSDHGRATRMATELEFGTVWINCHQVIPPEAPHGGFKSSGVGKDLSFFAMEEYSRIKHVMSSHS